MSMISILNSSIKTIAQRTHVVSSFARAASTCNTISTNDLKGDTFKTDVLVVGCGIAGCSTALAAAQGGCHVTMLSLAENIQECNSYWAQGGIVYRGKKDSIDLLANDILVAGANENKKDAVLYLSKNGPKAIDEVLLTKPVNVEFDHDDHEELDMTREGAHSTRRIIHYKDETGKAIIRGLSASVQAHPNIHIITTSQVIDLLTSMKKQDNGENICAGALIYNKKYDEYMTVYAKQVVLATGGLGELYPFTSNPPAAKGEGVALAKRIGAKTGDMEYVQFHPTALYVEHNRNFLLTESLRGEGAVLLNTKNEEFAKKYHPLGNLAPRDIVSRMIYREMLKNNSKHCYLDISFKPHDWITSRFPQVYTTCLSLGHDLTKGPIPCVPAAHFSCGGVLVDNHGQTNIQNLLCIGEVSCTGVHGANRLASTSLLEGLTWGHFCGMELSQSISSKSFISDINGLDGNVYENINKRTEAVSPAVIKGYWDRIHSVMWDNVGIIRTPKKLNESICILNGIKEDITKTISTSKPDSELYSLRNSIDTALCVATDAVNQPVSHGCHYILADNKNIITEPEQVIEAKL
ncbi:hypothetical protein WA158_004237 [Blastocystis sp. Blastoise]